MMQWVKPGLLVAALALGWWFAERATADGGDGQPLADGIVRPRQTFDLEMIVKPKGNPDPGMIVTPPWPPREPRIDPTQKQH